MMSSSGLEAAEIAGQSSAGRPNGEVSERKTRKRRIRFSCIECRKKKMSCDRNLPCQRCIKSGKPSQCSYDTVTEKPSALNPYIHQQEQQIRDLQSEVGELKELLSEVRSARESDGNTDASHAIDHAKSDQSTLLNRNSQEAEGLIGIDRDVESTRGIDSVPTDSTNSLDDGLDRDPTSAHDTELSDPRERFPQGFYGRHTLFRFFSEVPDLFPFIRETAEEWFKPLGVSLPKTKLAKSGWDMSSPSQKETSLESLLPPKDDTDALVSFYLDGLEQLHRIVHIPTFKREYANFWIPKRARYASMTALILAMISISTCASARSADATAILTKYRAMPAQWIPACDEWLKQQGPKHRKLVHYQISCLIYLAKRVNMISKKIWWKETSSLIQDAIMDGLHCDPSSTTFTPYAREIKRRIWAVLRELDLQNAFEYGFPTLLHNVESDVAPPTNLDDEKFSETSEELPTSEPLRKYTVASYQVHSSRSWSLRLEISQRLFSTRLSNPLSYNEVLRYTHELTQAIHAIPSWDTEDATRQTSSKHPALAHAILLFQLKDCILALHRPYLQKADGRYWLSETVCHQTARDILLLNSKLEGLGLQSLTALRDDLLLASLTLVHITMLQPKDSTSIIMTGSQSTIDLLEQCLPFMENIHLRCCYSELWCFMTMCAAIMLLKIRMGKESRQTARAACARRFLDLHYKQMERQKMCRTHEQCLATSHHPDHIDIATSQLASPSAPDLPTSGWLDSNYPDFGIDAFDLDFNMDNTWDMWEPPERPGSTQAIVE
ncbi:hypothetical protein F4677DRAFT_392700 [Hypoxylon crocopeplum]|nr:hypothetical protein F4677DRAFT_392700 [Hypoxylon crocopeplum]